MSSSLLSILIPSLPERVTAHLLPLWTKLQAQIAQYAVSGQVEVCVFLDNRQRTTGEKRDALVQLSHGAYVAFVDDDDDVTDLYIPGLLQAIQRNPGVDVVTFRQRAIINGVEGICTFGLNNPNEQFSPHGFRRSAWHVCAWRGDLARRYRFPATAAGEDWAWARHLVIEAESSVHINEVLHVYRYDPSVSAGTPGVIPGQSFSWQDIPGWFDFPEVYDAAVKSARPGAVFVELGCYLGKSAAYMLLAIRDSGKAITFNSYDTFKGSPTEPSHLEEVAKHGGSLLDAARANLARCCGPDGPYALVEADSVQAATLYADQSVDFCYIDADHTEAAVARDIEAWLPKMRPGGILAGHDYDSPGVSAAVDRLLKPIYNITVSGRSWIIQLPDVDDVGRL